MTASQILVVAAALIDRTDRVLVAQRPAGKAHAGLWEFPGGKVEPGETLAAALVREIDEELGLTIDPTAIVPVAFATRVAEGRELVLLLYAVERWDGEPVATEHQSLVWEDAGNLGRLPMPPADRALLRSLERHLASR